MEEVEHGFAFHLDRMAQDITRHLCQHMAQRQLYAETDRMLGEAHKLFDKISNMLTEMRRERVQRRLRRTLAHWAVFAMFHTQYV